VGDREPGSARAQVLLDRRHAAVGQGERHRLRGCLVGTDLGDSAAPRPHLLSRARKLHPALGEALCALLSCRPRSRGLMSDYAVQRERMVRDLIAARGVRDERVLAGFGKTPPPLFVKDHLGSQAYGDHALPIGSAQTISQPYIVARMSELLEVGPEHSVLEIGTGSGYQTAVLALLARRVYSLERVPELAQAAIPRMRQLGFDNVNIQVFDGTVGWTERG